MLAKVSHEDRKLRGRRDSLFFLSFFSFHERPLLAGKTSTDCNIQLTVPCGATPLCTTCDVISLDRYLRCLKVMLHGTIRNDDFQCNTTLQFGRNHVVTIQNNDVAMLLYCIALKIVVANRLVQHHLKQPYLNGVRDSVKQARDICRKICRCFEWNHLAALTFLKIFWGSLTFSLKKFCHSQKGRKKTSKKIFKKDEKEEYRRRKPAVKTKDKSQGCSVTFLPTNVSLHAPVQKAHAFAAQFINNIFDNLGSL